ncbi:MAG: cupin domain-containing protein [Muribaculaceae bacterium]|nr:cupin domain-containing protein [Muribaculaceae bacterium]
MQIILLSGGSGTRLWPLSNDARSKQFLRLLPSADGNLPESMIQRVVRQLKSTGMDVNVTVATSASQQDAVTTQLGKDVSIVTEPSRRNTFPAICLACEYLAKQRGCADDEIVVVMPCDPFTESGYFDAIQKMAEAVAKDAASLMVMGITPTYPSQKYGYVVPEGEKNGIIRVKRFTEKPDVATAEKLIEEGAKWNGGVFAFRLGYMIDIAEKYVKGQTFAEIRENYDEFPKISFDYEVAEKADNIGMIPFSGEWKDLGTWNTLTDELEIKAYGDVTLDGTGENTHVFNELGIPMMCIGTQNLVIAASPDGILVTEKSKSENIKKYAEVLKTRPMFEERRWGTYRVIDHTESADGFCSLTKHLTLNPGCALSYQRHSCRNEIWTFIEGEGTFVLDGERRHVRQGDTVIIPMGAKHTLKAITRLSFIEVQTGSNLIEEDIERFEFTW